MSFREGERDEALSILQELSSAFGVSGFEEDVRGAIVRRVEPIVDELITDPLGNVHGVMNPQGDFTVLLVAHMDEIGFMVTSIDEKGFLGVGPIGSWDPALALGKSVIIRGWDGNLELGLVGTIPPHIKGQEKDSRAPQWKEVFVDIGASSRKEVEGRRIRVGSPGLVMGHFSLLKEDVVAGKALDDRAGCTALMMLLRRIRGKRVGFRVVVAFSVAEELGARGAKVIASRWKPHLALIVEGTSCTDTPGVTQYHGDVRCGGGPVITVADKSIVVPHLLVEAILMAAKTRGIPFQIKPPFVGSTDAGAIHLSGEGVPTGVLAIPCRYIHSPKALMRLEDLANALDLLEAILDEAPAIHRRLIGGSPI